MQFNQAIPPDLAGVRRNKGVTLQEISARTRIRVTYLEAIEARRFEKLPGGVYNTSYVRQYARAIDYDEDSLLAFYYRETGTEPLTLDLTPAPAAPRRTFSQFLRFPVFRMFA
jgi:cytoskeletal protein RodZ